MWRRSLRDQHQLKSGETAARQSLFLLQRMSLLVAHSRTWVGAPHMSASVGQQHPQLLAA
jgi:hypothetical protein